MADRERFLVELEAEPHPAPAINRLRRFLKLALRAYGLRCTDIREVRHESNNERATEGTQQPGRSAGRGQPSTDPEEAPAVDHGRGPDGAARGELIRRGALTET
jgi:hypothetical protein